MTVPIVPGPPNHPQPTPGGPAWMAPAGKRVVTFDGSRVAVTDHRGRVEWHAPIEEVGQILIRRRGLLEIRPFKRSGLRAHLVSYRRADTAGVQQLVEAVWSVLRQRPADQQPTQPSTDDKLLSWALRANVWLSAAALVPAALGALALLAICGVCGWALLAR